VFDDKTGMSSDVLFCSVVLRKLVNQLTANKGWID